MNNDLEEKVIKNFKCGCNTSGQPIVQIETHRNSQIMIKKVLLIKFT